MSGLEERDASNRAGALSRGRSTSEVLSQPAAGTCTSFILQVAAARISEAHMPWKFLEGLHEAKASQLYSYRLIDGAALTLSHRLDANHC